MSQRDARPQKELRFHPDHRARAGVAPLHAERLYELIGVEHSLIEVERAIRTFIQREKPPLVGATLVTCSDESEYECAAVFRRGIVRQLLPARMFDDKSAFRQATLGGRYEWGAARVAESHFALAPGAQEWKLMLLKVNAHVGVHETPDGPTFGRLARYEGLDLYCGALAALLAGDTRPFAEDLAETLRADGLERVAILRDAAQVDPAQRSLFAALVSARMQARRAMLDVQDHAPLTPTLTMIVPCVTLNRTGHDTEIVVGVYFCDRRGAEPHDEYAGLGDDPRGYRLDTRGSQLVLHDEHRDKPRLARDHRALVARALDAHAPHEGARAQVQAALKPALAGDHALTKAALAAVFGTVLAVAPIPAVLALFAEGALGIHHAVAVHRLARKAEGDDAALELLDDLRGSIDGLEPKQARHLVELLRRTYA